MQGGKVRIIRALKDISGQVLQVILITHMEDVKKTLPYTLGVTLDPAGIGM